MFSVFSDQENVGQVGLSTRHLAAGPRAAPVGKTFQGGSSKIAQPVQRKALRDVNRDLGKADSKGLGGDGKAKQPFLKPAQPVSKPKPKQRLSNSTEEKPTKAKSERTEDDLPPIEYMPTWNETDTYDDIWAPHERPSTYIEAFRDWRPAHVFPTAKHSSDSEEEVVLLDALADVREDSSLLEKGASVGELESTALLSLEDLGLSLPPPHELFSDCCMPTDGL